MCIIRSYRKIMEFIGQAPTNLNYNLCQFFLTGIFLPYWLPFAMGILLFCLMEKNIKPSVYKYNGFFKLLLALLLVIGFYILTVNVKIYSITFSLYFTLLMWLFEIYEKKYQTLISANNRILLLLSLLGSISYSIYLIHAKVIILSEQILRQVFPSNFILFPFAAMILTLCICYAFYYYFERPFIKKKVA